MRIILKSLLIIALAGFTSYAQKSARINAKENIDIKLSEELLSPTKQDIELADSESLNVFKLLPRGKFDFVKNALSLRGGGSFYSFKNKSHSYDETPQIALEQNNLKVGFYGASYGLFSDLGQSTFEMAKLTAEANFMLKYEPPKFEAKIRAEVMKLANHEATGLQFRRRVPASVGNAYLLRAISFNEADTLVFFKIHRQDADGSLIIFWKSIKDFETPVILRRTDEELKAEIETLLRKKAFLNVAIEVKDNVVVLRGSVPRGKMAEAVMTAQESKPQKIENQLTEQQ